MMLNPENQEPVLHHNPESPEDVLEPRVEKEDQVNFQSEGVSQPSDMAAGNDAPRRRNTGDQKVESMFRVFRQSFIEAIGAKNWKTISGESVEITHNPEVEEALHRLDALHSTYNDMSKILAQHAQAVKQLSMSQELVGKFFTEMSVHEQDTPTRESTQSYGAHQKHWAKVSLELQTNLTNFQQHVNTISSKAVEDCLTTAKKYNQTRLEHDSFKNKLTSLQADVAKDPTPKREKDLATTKDQFEEAKKVMDAAEKQVILKVNLLYEHKEKHLGEQIALAKKAMDQYLQDSARAFEISDSDN